MVVKLSLGQIWALPDFTILQYLNFKGFTKENWLVDRLRVTSFLANDGVLRQQDENLTKRSRFNATYQLSDGDLIIKAIQVNVLETRFDLLRLILLLSHKAGKLYTFGSNRRGQLGLGDNINRNMPTEVVPYRDVLSVSCGNNHTAFITDNKLYTFGNNLYNRLGINGNINRNNRAKINDPTLVEFNKWIVSVSCGGSHTAIITDEQNLYTFGGNYGGQLGLGHSGWNNRVIRPTLVEFDKNVVSVSCGKDHTAIITDDGKLYTFGSNDRSQLGLGDFNNRDIPTLLNLPKKIVALSCGDVHTAIITEDGELYTFGNNHDGQLGLGNIRGKKRPVLVPFDTRIMSVSCGGDHTAVIIEDGKLYTFGWNYYGQLGLGDRTNRNRPTLVEFDKQIISVSCGDTHTAIIVKNDKLYTFGNNQFGKLGLGDSGGSAIKYKPTLVEFNEKIISVSCGGDHTAIITEE